MQFEVKKRELVITVDKSIYNLDVLHKCFYWYGSSFDVSIHDLNEQHYQIELSPQQEGVIMEEMVSKVKRDLIDFKLRDTVTKETRTVRDLIVAKAFAYYDSDDNNPTTDLSDPVGFDPLSI